MDLKKMLGALPRNFFMSINRFPLSFFCSGAGTMLMIAFNYENKSDQSVVLLKGAMVLFMGMFLFTLVQILCERLEYRGRSRPALYLCGIIFISVYFMFMPSTIQDCDTLRYSIICASFFLMIFIVPFAGRGAAAGRIFQLNLWRMGKWFAYAVIASGILYTGIVMAYLMVSSLFDITKGDYLLYAFFVCGGFAAPVIFLHGFPDYSDPAGIEQPEGFIRRVIDYVMVPLVLLYIVILAVYFGGIIFTRQMPKGTTAYLVLSCSLLGVFVYYLVYGENADERAAIERFFTRVFFWCLVPLSVLLWIAIIMRLSEYGVTENRYIVMVSASWLTAVTIHGLAVRKKNLVTWPMILAVIMLLSTFGPWGMFSVSMRSQYARMIEICSKYGIIREGRLARMDGLMDPVDSINLSSAIDYMLSSHGSAMIAPLVTDKIRANEMAAHDGDWNWRIAVQGAISREFNLRLDSAAVKGKYYYFSLGGFRPDVVDLEKLDYLINIQLYSSADIQAGMYTVSADHESGIITVSAGGKTVFRIDIGIYASGLTRKYKSSEYSIPAAEMIFRLSKKTARCKVIIENISFYIDSESRVSFENGNVILLIGE